MKANNKNKHYGDPLRHEWISVLLLNIFVNKECDDKWLLRLANGDFDETLPKIQEIINPLENLPPAAGLIAWLVVSHHRLPLRLPLTVDDYRGEESSAESLNRLLGCISKKWGYENIHDDQAYQKRLDQCFNFPKGTPNQSNPWLEAAKKWAARLQKSMPLLYQAMENGCWRLILHHARLSLMLGDHHYSSKKDPDRTWNSSMELIANTYREPDSKKGQPKQKLDEHLVGVATSALDITKLLPRIENDLPYAHDVRALKKKSPVAFNWQDKAVDKIKGWGKVSSANIQQFFLL